MEAYSGPLGPRPGGEIVNPAVNVTLVSPERHQSYIHPVLAAAGDAVRGRVLPAGWGRVPRCRVINPTPGADNGAVTKTASWVSLYIYRPNKFADMYEDPKSRHWLVPGGRPGL